MLWRSSSKIRPAPGFIKPSLPTLAARPPIGPAWIYEIKADGYRLIVRRNGDRVRIFTRRGVDWTDRYPLIVEGVRALKAESVTLDGEGVICRPDGMTDFDQLHSRVKDHEVRLYAFDLLELDGADLRREPLLSRKAALERLLRRQDGRLLYSEHLVADGAHVFECACRLGLEGIVAKRIDSAYRSGRTRSWIKVKNPLSPAMLRLGDAMA